MCGPLLPGMICKTRFLLHCNGTPYKAIFELNGLPTEKKCAKLPFENALQEHRKIGIKSLGDEITCVIIRIF